MNTKQNNLTLTGRNNRKSGNIIGRASGQVSPLSDEARDLKQKLDTKPDIRADKVARGKALIADPNYPSKETMRNVAGLLAKKLAGRDKLVDSSAGSTNRAAITTITA